MRSISWEKINVSNVKNASDEDVPPPKQDENEFENYF
jgi:hypothetical protein